MKLLIKNFFRRPLHKPVKVKVSKNSPKELDEEALRKGKKFLEDRARIRKDDFAYK